MKKMPGFHEILEQHQVTPELLKHIEARIACLGYPEIKNYYIPVALISIGKPLNYILSNKEEVLNKDFASAKRITDKAILLL